MGLHRRQCGSREAIPMATMAGSDGANYFGGNKIWQVRRSEEKQARLVDF